MASVLNTKVRHVVPNFRRFRDTVTLGELDPVGPSAEQPVEVDFESRISEWRHERNLGLAGDIVSAALVSSDAAAPEIADAATFILDHRDLSSASLIDAAHGVLDRGKSAGAQTILLPGLHTLLEASNRQKTYRSIRTLKEAATRFGDDPILFTELARLYLIVGNEQRAKTYIAMALNLAPYNRYVLRSAARLYAHCEEADRGFDLLHANERTRHDPWLASAELAMAGVLGKAGRVIKSAARVLIKNEFSAASLTELRAGIGSLELLDGDRRRGKRLLQESLESPNDNALAQVEWALSRERLFDVDLGSFDVSRNYEALALEAFNQERWTDVIRHCESWLVDMPFASRPAMLATHVATVVLDDFAAAQLFCQAARLASGQDPQLVNNYAYALALDNKYDEALKILDEMPVTNVDDARSRACLTATRGLAYFRAGRIIEGRAMYGEAIAQAKGIDDPAFWNLALLNYAREEILAGQLLPEQVVDGIRRLKVRPRAVTTQILKNKVVALLDGTSAPAVPG